MNCTEVAAILDTHRSARLAAAERAAVDMHLLECDDCAAAWLAQTELLALRVPPMPTTLPERALLASRAPRSAEPRRARLPIVIGSVLLAGAALAGVTIVAVTRSTSAPSASPASPEQPALRATLQELREQVRPGAQAADTTSVELVETALGMSPLVRHPPSYPPEALAQGVEGHVQLKFDVTAAGVVENVSVVESSDERFEAAASEAIAIWRYLPRIAAGKRVRSDGVHTVVRFALGKEPPPDARQSKRSRRPPRRPPANSPRCPRGSRSRSTGSRPTTCAVPSCSLTRCKRSTAPSAGDLWNFYGYLYTVQGNYGRAIDAYETAVAVAARADFPTPGPFVQLANLYFARHQYDMALKTLLRSNLPGGNRLASCRGRLARFRS